jgi:hypothetical protein
VPTAGGSKGVDYLGCWPTEFGEAEFTLVKETGTGE